MIINDNPITLKIKYTVNSNDDKIIITNYIKNYNNCLRFTSNRLLENNKLSTKQITYLQKDLNNIFIDSHFKNSCIYDAKTFIKENQQSKIVFGGRQLLNKRNKGEITNEQWRIERLLPLTSIGEANKRGNRKFEILSQTNILFKPSKEEHISLNLCNLKKNYRIILDKLIQMQKLHLIPITYKLDLNYIYITFNYNFIDTKVYKESIKDRIFSIDLNPNYVGYTVCDWRGESPKIINSGVISFKYLNDLDNSLKGKGLSSSSKERQYIYHKRKHELIEASHQLIKLASHYRCQIFALEDLNIQPRDLSKGKRLNKLVNNQWCRDLISKTINKLCPIYNIEILKVNAQYSSYTGNICYRHYGLPDMCLSALEIGRRAYEFYHQYHLKDKEIQKNIILNNSKQFINNAFQSLEELGLHDFEDCVDLKSIFNKIKNSKVRYRVQLNENNAVFSKFYLNKLISYMNFNSI